MIPNIPCVASSNLAQGVQHECLRRVRFTSLLYRSQTELQVSTRARRPGFRSAQGIRARVVPPSIPRPPLTPHGSSRWHGGHRRRTPRARWSGRGPTIDEPAMIKALSDNRIRAAALDVFDREPLPRGHPFYALENVLLSPHCADHTPDWLNNAMRFFLAQVERFRNGETLWNIVDKKLGY